MRKKPQATATYRIKKLNYTSTWPSTLSPIDIMYWQTRVCTSNRSIFNWPCRLPNEIFIRFYCCLQRFISNAVWCSWVRINNYCSKYVRSVSKYLIEKKARKKEIFFIDFLNVFTKGLGRVKKTGKGQSGLCLSI